ncbi:MAG: hypothetical protein MHM6MM_004086 [Cercozoa sp. M6MM]
MWRSTRRLIIVRAGQIRRLAADRAFWDRVRLVCRGGDGGKGNYAFKSARGLKRRIADGGDGGDGGNVIVRATSHNESLRFSKFHYRADKGKDGRNSTRTGGRGDSVVITVPPGTLVKEIFPRDKSDESFHLREAVIADLNEPGAEVVVARGGVGGRGNTEMTTTQLSMLRQAHGHSHYGPGAPGEQIMVELELKSIADVGLVGFPNAGKSTLLGALSKARPRVAPFPFTTLHPSVGIVESDTLLEELRQDGMHCDTDEEQQEDDEELDMDKDEKFSIADIPGLIDGAHEGRGLGHEFLRHVERTKVLLYVLDMAGTDGRDPLDDFLTLRDELRRYSASLADRPALIFANKMDGEQDLASAETSQRNLERLQQLLEERNESETWRVVAGTARAGRSECGDIVAQLHDMVRQAHVPVPDWQITGAKELKKLRRVAQKRANRSAAEAAETEDEFESDETRKQRRARMSPQMRMLDEALTQRPIDKQYAEQAIQDAMVKQAEESKELARDMVEQAAAKQVTRARREIYAEQLQPSTTANPFNETDDDEFDFVDAESMDTKLHTLDAMRADVHAEARRLQGQSDDDTVAAEELPQMLSTSETKLLLERFVQKSRLVLSTCQERNIDPAMLRQKPELLGNFVRAELAELQQLRRLLAHAPMVDLDKLLMNEVQLRDANRTATRRRTRRATRQRGRRGQLRLDTPAPTWDKAYFGAVSPESIEIAHDSMLSSHRAQQERQRTVTQRAKAKRRRLRGGVFLSPTTPLSERQRVQSQNNAAVEDMSPM